MNIGMAGTGRMGSAIATRLIRLGHALTVWNRTPERAKAAVAAGATLAARPAELATRADVIITILTNAAAIDAVYYGEAVSLAKPLAGGDTGPAAFDLDAMRKDLHTVLEEAQSLGVELPTAARERPHLSRFLDTVMARPATQRAYAAEGIAAPFY